MNVQNQKQLRQLCGDAIPASIQAFVDEAEAAYLRLKGGEFSVAELVLLWTQAVRSDRALVARLRGEGKNYQQWTKTKSVEVEGEKIVSLVDEDRAVTVDWAGLNRAGKFVKPDPDSETHLIVSLNDMRGETEKVPVCRVTRKQARD